MSSPAQDALLPSQEELHRDRDHLRLLLEINNAVVSRRDLSELLLAISQALRRVLPHDYSSLCLYDAGSREFRVHALDFPEGRGIIREAVSYPARGTPASEAIDRRCAVVVPDLAARDFPPDSIPVYLRQEGIRSACWVPLVHGDACIGSLCLGTRGAWELPDELLTLLTEIGSQLAIGIENALAFRQIQELRDKLALERSYLENEIRADHNEEEMIGRHPAWLKVLEQIDVVAPTDATVLILGETGTGKELIARAIHNRSPRRERTFVKLNCSAVPTGLLESELFGHEKGAFTGAIARQLGRFELAHKGTLLLDEIGDIPLDLQPKLLRALQEQQFERLGNPHTLKVDVRVIASTNRNLAEAIAQRQFREDLYYRLNVFPILVPPLRERRSDIPLLVHYFVHRHAARIRRRVHTVPPALLDRLERAEWPGNVRELENFIERAVILCRDGVLHMPAAALPAPAAPPPASLASTEREHILRVLRECGGRIGGADGAAERLGLKRTTLNARLRKLGITRDQI
jgi:formate hydrogenlyase transcriptional activator